MKHTAAKQNTITQKKHHKKKTHGFTMIEVMIGVVVGSLIVLVVIFSVSQLRKQHRSRQRRADAHLIIAAVKDCLANNRNDNTKCREPEALNLDPNELNIFRTIGHYRPAGDDGTGAVNTWVTDGVWFFNTECVGESWVQPSGRGQSFTVIYIDWDGSVKGHCIDA